MISEFSREREEMVIGLVQQGYLKTEKIIKVLNEIPRHFFVNDTDRNFAYADYPMAIPSGQTISAPHMVALMTELIETKPSDKVLEIGSGSGYQAAVLSKLVKKVYSIETDSELASFAQENLARAGIKNVEIMNDDGRNGYPKEKPYDKIIVTCATPEIFKEWTDQLKVGGILLAPLGSGNYQELMRIKKTNKGLEKQEHGGCVFVPLR